MANKICGQCHYYQNYPVSGPICTKTRKEISYLQTAFDCFTEPGTAPSDPVQTKVCSHCGRELPVSNFGRHSRTKDGYQPCCKECQSEMNKGHRKRGPFQNNEAPAKPEEPETIPEGMKKCCHCGRILPVTEFRRHKKSPDGLQYACKECQVEMTTKAKQKRTENRKKVIREAQKEVIKEKILAGDPDIPKVGIHHEVVYKEVPIINDLTDPIPPVPTLYGATDEELVEELKKRGYTGNIIRKTSFIL